MKKHLYNTTLGKAPWFIERFGAAEMFFKPLRLVFAPAILATLPRKTFEFQGRALDCFYHRYNMTWACERCVEIPAAREYLKRFQGQRILEVGNVLSHYAPVQHQVLDKFEKAEGVINQDILDFRPPERFDLILSISTFEHIGFDDESTEPSRDKIKAAIAACRALLRPGGLLVVTMPIGYNPDADALIASGELGCDREHFLRRETRLDWKPATRAEALQCRYKTPFPYANAVIFAEFGPA